MSLKLSLRFVSLVRNYGSTHRHLHCGNLSAASVSKLRRQRLNASRILLQRQWINGSGQFYSVETNTGQQTNTDATVNVEEVAKFSRLSGAEWWEETGEFAPLHTMNRVRVPFIRDALLQQLPSGARDQLKPLTGLRIIDVGCGAGILAEPLARLGANVTGLDAVQENIEAAQWHASLDSQLTGHLQYVCDSVETVASTQPAAFDAVVASEVIEHVDNVSSFVSSCTQVLKPGGSLFVTTPNKTWLSYVLAVFGAERVFKLVPVGIHDWNKFVPPEDLELVLNQNGCDVRQVHGLMLNPCSLRWSWTSVNSVSYAMHAVKKP